MAARAAAAALAAGGLWTPVVADCTVWNELPALDVELAREVVEAAAVAAVAALGATAVAAPGGYNKAKVIGADETAPFQS